MRNAGEVNECRMGDNCRRAIYRRGGLTRIAHCVNKVMIIPCIRHWVEPRTGYTQWQWGEGLDDEADAADEVYWCEGRDGYVRMTPYAGMLRARRHGRMPNPCGAQEDKLLHSFRRNSGPLIDYSPIGDKYSQVSHQSELGEEDPELVELLRLSPPKQRRRGRVLGGSIYGQRLSLAS
jgi:hypothetical protein